jgi:thiosulfate/3-mercaptopyruvate sulfurtransferase
MTTSRLFKILFVLIALPFSQTVFAQKPINWTPEQLMEPAQLASQINAGKKLPLIFSIGPGALIPNSVDIGSVDDEENLHKLQEQLKKTPKNASIVVYCGCCPFAHCPNVRPAVQALKDGKFTNYKLLNLQKNLKADWIDKGYPTSK